MISGVISTSITLKSSPIY